MTESEPRIGEVIWYNERKGGGFVKIDNAEVFIHHSTLYRFGLIHQLTGGQVSVSLATNASKPDEGETRAMVKSFNNIRGYGFVTAKDLNEHVFDHSQVLNDCGFHSLMKEQKLLIQINDSGRSASR